MKASLRPRATLEEKLCALTMRSLNIDIQQKV